MLINPETVYNVVSGGKCAVILQQVSLESFRENPSATELQYDVHSSSNQETLRTKVGCVIGRWKSLKMQSRSREPSLSTTTHSPTWLVKLSTGRSVRCAASLCCHFHKKKNKKKQGQVVSLKVQAGSSSIHREQIKYLRSEWAEM